MCKSLCKILRSRPNGQAGFFEERNTTELPASLETAGLCMDTSSLCHSLEILSMSYKHSDENPVTCNGPPVEIPGEYTDKLNVTYTYSVRLKKTKLSSGLLGGIRFWSLCLILIFSGLGLSCLGFPSPANGGALMACATVLWVLLGTPARYVSAIMYKTFKGVKWKTNALLTALLCPGIIIGGGDLF
nr:uncharacterized protein LOC102141840 isoform X1 [Macaca fascicularis]